MEQDYLGIRKELVVNGKKLSIYSLGALQQKGYRVAHLPFCIRILLENILRNYDGYVITREHLETILNWKPRPAEKEIPFMPARVLMQDFTGVPAIVDIASLRGEMVRQGKDPSRINPLIPVDLVIDHSVQVDYFGNKDSYTLNVDKEYERNSERYRFLKWAQTAFNNFSVVPPGMGICHQVNLEYLSKCVLERNGIAFPDSLVGTDSHTPMVNGLGIVAYGVGGIEAEAAMLGQPQFFAMPEVIGLKLKGRLPVGSTATDLVLTITELLRKTKVVGKFVEVFGEGLAHYPCQTEPPSETCHRNSDAPLLIFQSTIRPSTILTRPTALVKSSTLLKLMRGKIYCGVKTKMKLSIAMSLTLISDRLNPRFRVRVVLRTRFLLKDAKQTITGIIEKKFFRKYIQHIDRPLNRWADEGGNVVPSQVAVAEHP